MTRPTPLLPLAVLWAIFATALLVALRPTTLPITDGDVWWHLAAGRWIAQHGALPATDPFAASHRPWVAYSWLFELALHACHAAFGLAGILVFRAALALAVVFLMYRLVRRRQPHFLAAAGLTLAGLIGLWSLISERPWMVSIAGVILTAEAIRDPSRALWLPLVFALWANAHVQFVYGLALLGLAVVTGPAPRPRLAALTALCALATLATPYHVHLWRVVFELATQRAPYLHITELQSPELRTVPEWTWLALFAAALFTLARRRPTRPFHAAWLALAAFLAFRAERDTWMLVIASLAVLAESLEVPSPSWLEPERSWRLPLALTGMLATLGACVFALRGYRDTRLEEQLSTAFPLRAAAHVEAARYPGPLFNDFNWGGFLIMWLPRLPVLIDGRTNLHGEELLVRNGRTWAGLAGWNSDPDLAAAGVVLGDRAAPLCALLAADPRFRQVYEDDVARVFVRTVR